MYNIKVPSKEMQTIDAHGISNKVQFKNGNNIKSTLFIDNPLLPLRKEQTVQTGLLADNIKVINKQQSKIDN